MANKGPTYFAVTPINAVQPLLGQSKTVVWIPVGSEWQQITTLPQTFAPLTGFAIVATTAKVLNVADATQLGISSLRGDSDPWPVPPARDDGETLDAYVARIGDSEAAA